MQNIFIDLPLTYKNKYLNIVIEYFKIENIILNMFSDKYYNVKIFIFTLKVF